MKYASIISYLLLFTTAAFAAPSKTNTSLGEWSVSVFTNEWSGDIVYHIDGGYHDIKESYKTLSTAQFRIELTNPEVKNNQFYFNPRCYLSFTYNGCGDDTLIYDIDTPMSRFKFDGKKPNGYAAKFDLDLDTIEYYESEPLLRNIMKSKHTDIMCYMLNKKSSSTKKISFGIDSAGLPQAVHEAKLAFLKWGMKGKSKFDKQ